MKCNQCNQIIPDDSGFCHLCGNKIPEEPTYAEPKKPKKDKKPMSKKTRKAIMLTIISILSLAIIAILVFLFVIPMVKYNHAQELLENGKYDLAYSAFAELDDYSDSQDKLIETRYLQAVDYRKAGEYDVANSIFESLGDYRDSKALIHIHDYTVSDSVAPTCTSKGSQTSICSGCGNSKVKIIDTIAHNYVLSKQTKPTCISPGEDIYACSECEASYKKAVDMVSHNYVLSKQTKPTCIASGEDTYACSGCGASYKKAVAVVSHNYVLAKQTNATCLSAGEKRYSCSMCGDSYTEKIAQTSHNWKNATCSAPKTCTTCGKTEGSALGHSNNVVCSRCGVTLFKTLEYSGYGVGYVMDIDLPKGKYNFIINYSGGGYFKIDFNDRMIKNSVGSASCVHQYTSSGLTDGYFNITSAEGYWTIKIEAIGN